ncbi:hypothetical protein GPECTOR_18g45 [Gonium pectorale]|uniref:Serine-threonine/tyrosine-protein kinase catalytic domain-containing protein n=1 Tax=Gonium pectorale TaxID=33097 RepID=A0A150GJS9_GONPE|nr:hypothetical protein GPECTOR_18g45 [Gonium pectorale]|eukprot:KXZ50066.1 hypothetical protein GPECTOR_18g45 [Gonium pectorale]
MTGSLRRVPPDCDRDWAELMQACWNGTPRNRPSFSEIAERLDALLAKLNGQDLNAAAGSSGGGGGAGGGGTSRRS